MDTLQRVYDQVDGCCDPHRILGFCWYESPLTTDINTAFRKLALILHPDKCSNPNQVELHTRLFRIIQAAKEHLLASLNPGTLHPSTTPEDDGTPRSNPNFPPPNHPSLTQSWRAIRLATKRRREAIKAKKNQAQRERNRKVQNYDFRRAEKRRAVIAFLAVGAEAHALRKAGRQREAYELLEAARKKLDPYLYDDDDVDDDMVDNDVEIEWRDEDHHAVAEELRWMYLIDDDDDDEQWDECEVEVVEMPAPEPKLCDADFPPLRTSGEKGVLGRNGSSNL